MTLKISVIGKTGQLAQALAEQVQKNGHEAVFYDRTACDLSQSPALIEKFIQEIPKLDVLVIAAAYTNVDGAETEKELAFSINAHAPAAIAKVCAERGIPLVHISTDCVFDGQASMPYVPEDMTNPPNVYGASKLAGEKFVLSSGARAAILRTSWVYGAKARNFLAIMLTLAQTHSEVRVVENHIGCPTNVLHLADAIILAAQGLIQSDKKYTGVFHVCGGSGPVTRAEFARLIFEKSADYLPYDTVIVPVNSQAFPMVATRPAYCAFDTDAFEITFGCTLPPWDDGLEQACKDWFQQRAEL